MIAEVGKKGGQEVLLMYERLLSVLNATGKTRVLLVGDFMLDTYLCGNIDRISPEAPVMVLNVTGRQTRPGGAGSVAADLVALGAEVACLGIVGDDRNGAHLRESLSDLAGVRTEGLIVVADRPTTSKERIIGLAQHRHQQQLMRIDEECATPIGQAVREELEERLETLLEWCDVVCLEDYDKGVLCPEFCGSVIAAARKAGKKVLVDPAMLGDYSRYAGAWLVKPNRRELSRATGVTLDGEDSWLEAAGKLTDDHGIENVVVTLDKQGAFVYSGGGDSQEDPRQDVIPTRARTVYDVTGAGDMVLAMLGVVVGAAYETVEPPSLAEAVALANVAGGLEVERFGSVGVSRDEIVSELAREQGIKTGKLRSAEALQNELRWHRQQKLKVVFTNGCFDLLHSGHIGLLSQAKEQGDILVVAINSDRSVRELKGSGRPIHNEQERAALLSALHSVDYVVIFDTPTPIELIKQVRPDVLVKGSDWSGAVVGQEWVEENGGRVALVPLSKGRSTTNIIEQVIQKNADRVGKADKLS